MLYRLSLLLVLQLAGWQHHAEARQVAAAPSDMATDPQAVLAVDPQLAVADQAVVTAPVLVPGQAADVPEAQLAGTSGHVMGKPLPPGAPGGGTGGGTGGASTFCGAKTPSGACGDVTVKGTTLQCDVGGLTGTTMQYSSGDKRFVATDFK